MGLWNDDEGDEKRLLMYEYADFGGETLLILFVDEAHKQIKIINIH